MKKAFISLFILIGVQALHAQSLKQAEKNLYYERYHTAANNYHDALKEDQENASAWHGLTTAYLLQDKLNGAKDTLMFATASVQLQPLYKIAYGSILLQENKIQEATDYFKQALDMTKERNPDILAAVAEAHLNAKNGDVTYAASLLEKAIKKDKRNPKLLVLLGDAYRKQLNGTEAYKAYQRALNADDKYAAAYHRLGKIFVAQNNVPFYLEYFQKAIAADTNYAPAIYEMYYYEFNRDPARSLEYYKDYVAKSDASPQRDYDLADLLYLNKNYEEASAKAKEIIETEAQAAKPRLYKLLGYSYAALKDTQQALSYMQTYFLNAADSNRIAKDYETMADLYTATGGKNDSVAAYYEQAIQLEKDSAVIFDTYKKLAVLARQSDNYPAQANWLGKYYTGNKEANNLDLFNWALAWYRAEDYQMADSVFGMYTNKYPDQSYGYYWQAKSQAFQDSLMESGLAVPTYQKLIEVLQNDTANSNFKRWMIEAYGYLAAYEANAKKDYSQAVDYFEKVLEVDPANADAKKYIAILEKDLAERNKNKLP